MLQELARGTCTADCAKQVLGPQALPKGMIFPMQKMEAAKAQTGETSIFF